MTHWTTPFDDTAVLASEFVDNNLAFAADPSDYMLHNFSLMTTRKRKIHPSDIVLYSASVDKMGLADMTVRSDSTEVARIADPAGKTEVAAGIADPFGMTGLADMD